MIADVVRHEFRTREIIRGVLLADNLAGAIFMARVGGSVDGRHHDRFGATLDEVANLPP